MNWLEISVGVIFLICVIAGMVKGAVKLIVSLLATVITVVVVFFATPYVAQVIEKYTPIDDVITEKVASGIADAAASAITGEESLQNSSGLTEEAVKKVLKAAGIDEDTLSKLGISVADIVNGKISSADLAKYGISENILDGLTSGDSSEIEKVIENVDIPKELQETAIKSADIPEIFKTLLLKNNTEAMYKELGVTTFTQYVGAYLARMIVNVIAFLITFIIVTLILRAIIFALDVVTELPVLGCLNRIAGAGLGIVIALIIVWVIFIIFTLLYTTTIGRSVYAMIQDNTWLKLIYDYNPLMKIAVSM